MTRNRLAVAVCLSFLLTPILHAQTGPIKVQAGATQVVVTVPQGAVTIKKQPTRGTVKLIPDPPVSGRPTQVSYVAPKPSESVTDSFTYDVDKGADQEVTLQIDPLTFDLDQETYQKIFKAIFLLFILAVVLESGLALLFNWRPFIEIFNARATKPIVSFVFAYLFVRTFDLDLMTSIVAAASSKAPPPGVPGQIITAMVLAGGSAGVNNILIALGFRQARTPDTVTPKPPLNKAWISFRLERNDAVGGVEVFLGPTPAPLPGTLPLVGVIKGTSMPGFRFFLRDPGRFPGSGGHEVPAGTPLSFVLTGKKEDKTDVSSQRKDDIIVASGAIIDLDVRI